MMHNCSAVSRRTREWKCGIDEVGTVIHFLIDMTTCDHLQNLVWFLNSPSYYAVLHLCMRVYLCVCVCVYFAGQCHESSIVFVKWYVER